MKSPEELSQKLTRQWENADLREARLLGRESAWPISLPIGRPAPGLIAADFDAVKRHVERWRQVRIGSVIWNATSYRATSEPVDMPARWELSHPTEWVAASNDRVVRAEFDFLTELAAQTDPTFHTLLIRRRSLWRGRTVAEIVQASRVAIELEPCGAAGKTLRMFSLAGIDTKFFERNKLLITALLDVRFDGEASQVGLETFLGAATANGDWLLVADLDGSLLPFHKQRIPSFELTNRELPAQRILIVENEQSLHQLPALSGAIAVLGAGFNLSWAEADWLQIKQIAYWGDIDTWGLQFLARARSALPDLSALMMTPEVYDAYHSFAVAEPVTAGDAPPDELNTRERALYERLLVEQRGRLEQEFLPIPFVHQAILNWACAGHQ